MVRRILKRAIRAAYDLYRTVRPRHEPPPAPPVVPPAPAPEPAPVAEDPLDAEVDAVIAKQAKIVTAAKPAVEVFVWSEATPNPNAMKFQASVRIVESGSLSFTSVESAADHPLGRVLFEVPGVRIVFAVNDFVTITKEADASWTVLAPLLEAVITKALDEELA